MDKIEGLIKNVGIPAGLAYVGVRVADSLTGGKGGAIVAALAGVAGAGVGIWAAGLLRGRGGKAAAAA